MSSSTVEQLHAFHAQDRVIFAKLVLNFSRPLAESLLVMATWFWLEDFGFEHIFSIITALSDPFIAILADEAVLCFQCLEFTDPPNVFSQIPLTSRFMTKDISLRIIYEHRYSAIIGIKNFLTTICSRIFSDIIQKVLPSSSTSPCFNNLRRPLDIPGFPHPTFGSINVMPHVFVGNNRLNNNLFTIPNNHPNNNLFSIPNNHPNNNLFPIPSGVWGWNSTCIATENDRTVFLTFSRGFPVSEAEVKKLFTERYGENCVEGVYMPVVSGNSPNTIYNNNGQQQSLYARLVLDSVRTVDRILKGNSLRKFTMNKKHIWARKYEERREERRKSF